MRETLTHEREPKKFARPLASKTQAESVRVQGEAIPAGGGSRKRKVTISLSEKSLRALQELRDATDADTDSEVFRNALRLHLTLIRAHEAGVKLLMKKDDSEEGVPVTLFAQPE